MQLINDRQINQYKLPDSCYMIAAGNPEDVGNYQTNVMNDALKDRFIWFNMESSVPDWLQWASKNDNINDDVVDFIADYPEMLHVVNERDEVKPTPRSWQKFSDIIKVKLNDKNKKILNEDEYSFISTVGKGIIGLEASGSLINFLSDRRNPIPNFNELLSIKTKWKDDEIKNKLSGETNPRLAIMVQRLIKKFNEINDNKNSKEKVNDYTKGFTFVINCIPADLRVATIKDIANNHKSLHDVFIDDTEYMNAYLNILKRL